MESLDQNTIENQATRRQLVTLRAQRAKLDQEEANVQQQITETRNNLAKIRLDKQTLEAAVGQLQLAADALKAEVAAAQQAVDE